MAFDLGDPVPLVFTTKDATGALANVTTAVLTITLPDGTTVAPEVTTVSTGSYAPTTPYIAVQSGRHSVSWVGTGANAQAFTDAFDVMAADPGSIISLADARTALQLSPANTVKDDDVRFYIAAATPIMEDIVGSILRTTRTETFDGGSSQVCLLWAPVISVSSVVESWGANFHMILTPQDIFTGTGAGPWGYTLDSGGIVTRRSAGVVVAFAPGKRNIQVTYVSGRPTVTGNLLLATRVLIRFLWEQDQRSFRQQHPATEMALTPLGFAVPKRVLELCGPDARGPQVA